MSESTCEGCGHDPKDGYLSQLSHGEITSYARCICECHQDYPDEELEESK